MARRVERTKKARRDADSIWQFIASTNPNSADPDAADRVIRALYCTYDQLAEFPHRIQIEGRNLFRTTVDGFHQYLILYRFDDEKVEILRVFRGDLDWNRIVEGL